MELNATAFTWPKKILSVFDLCDEVLLTGPSATVCTVYFKQVANNSFFFQGIEAAKEKGMDELLAKRGRLKVQLEKVSHRIEEFPYYSEMDMTEQVSVNLACLKNWVLEDIRSVSYKVYLYIITANGCNCTLLDFVWAVFS